MAIWADKNTRVIVQGITGREGTFHAVQCREYGTNVVGGVTPGKGGTKHEGFDVFGSVREAREKARAELKAAREDLRALLTARQEAILANLGYL